MKLLSLTRVSGNRKETIVACVFNEAQLPREFRGNGVLPDIEGQHPRVRQRDRGKAIAVHAGYHPALGSNIGFKFTSKPYPMAERHGDAIDVASPAD